MRHVFNDAQFNALGHRKLIVVLKHLWQKLLELSATSQFTHFFTQLINYVLPCKRGDRSADRIAKFVGQFVGELSRDEESNDLIQMINYLMLHLIRGVHSKNKYVRYRVIQLIANTVQFLGEIDSEIFISLYDTLIEKTQDRESIVRIQAVEALLRFQGYEGEDGSIGDTTKHLLALLNDESAEVRRAVLLNLEKDSSTVPSLLARTRDVSSVNRRLVFSRVVRDLGLASLNEKQIELLLMSGLNDRDDHVKSATVNLIINSFLVACKGDLFELLAALHPDSSEVAERVLRGIFKMRPDLVPTETMNREFLQQLGIEQAFFFRVYYEFCSSNNLHEVIDQKFPDAVELLETLSRYLSLRRQMLTDDKALTDMLRDYEAKLREIDNAIFLNQNLTVESGHDMEVLDKKLKAFPDFRELKPQLEALKLRLTQLEKWESRQLNRAPRSGKKSNNVISDDDEDDEDEDAEGGEEEDGEEGGEDEEGDKSRYSSGNDDDGDFQENDEVDKVDEIDEIDEIDEVDENDDDLEADGDFDEAIDDASPADKELLKFKKHIRGLSKDELIKTYKELKDKAKSMRKEEKDLNAHGMRLKEIHEKAIRLVDSFSEQKYKLLLEKPKEATELEDNIKDLEFVIKQLLEVAKNYDFSDELARREMMLLMRKCLTNDNLSDGLVKAAYEVIHKLSINEKDFVQLATEIITDIRDSGEDDEEEDEFHSAVLALEDDDEADEILDDDTQQSNKKRKIASKFPPDEVIIQCLQMIQHVLELVEDPLENNPLLESFYFGIVNYALQEKGKYLLHILGLRCLGLYALISANIATTALFTFIKAMHRYGQEVCLIAIQVMVDIFATHGLGIVSPNHIFQFARMFHKTLNSYRYPKLQCTVAEGLCKLLLADLFAGQCEHATISEKELFESLLLCFFDNRIMENAELKQVLAFCIPVYAFSHPNHQVRVALVLGDCLFRLYASLESNINSTKIPASTVVQQLIYWCDPNNLVNVKTKEVESLMAHIWQAIYFLQAVEQETPKVVKRAILSNLMRMLISLSLQPTELEGLLLAIRDTKALLEARKSDPEFYLDKPTWRNFEMFESMIATAHENLVIIHTTRVSTGVSSVTSSRATSASPEPTSLDKTNSKIGNINESAANEPSPDASPKKSAVDESLKEIDKMLEEEENIEYDIELSNENEDD